MKTRSETIASHIVSLSLGTLFFLSACNGEAADDARSSVYGEQTAEKSNQTSSANEGVTVYGYRIVNRYPHDPAAFVQGLFFHDGALFESTGQVGESNLREVDIETGKVRRQVDLPSDVFGEGSVLFGDRVITLSWKAGRAFVHSQGDFQRKGEFSYDGEGWGLTSDGTRLIMSDGSPELRFLDPETFEEQAPCVSDIARPGDPQCQ